MQELHSQEMVFPRFNKEQQRFVFNKFPFILGSGGFGSGKTTALVCRVILLMVDSPWFGNCAGAEGVLGRYKQLDFTKTTLKEFFRWLPKSWIKQGGYNKKDGTVELKNESVVHFTHLDGIDHIQSYNLSFFAADQTEQIPREVWDAFALERIRRKAFTRYYYNNKGEQTGLIVPEFDEETGECISEEPEKQDAVVKYHTAFGVCNPRHGTWLQELFKENEEYLHSNDPMVQAKYNPEYKYIHVNVRENKHNLPGNYISRQKVNKSAREFARDVDGDWDAWSGKVYLGCDHNVIYKHNLIPHPVWDIYIGVDHGGTGEDKTMRTGVTAVTFLAYQHQAGRQPLIYAFDELYLSASTIEQTVAEIDAKLRRWHIAQLEQYPLLTQYENGGRLKVKAWRCDPSMNKKMDEKPYTIIERYTYFAKLRGMDMRLAPGDADWVSGIEKVDWMFRKGVLKICPKCTNTYNEHASLEYGESEKIKPMQRDHLVTALKYAASAFPREFNMREKVERPVSLVERELSRMAKERMQVGVGGRYGLGGW